MRRRPVASTLVIDALVERGWAPDWLIRRIIRRLLAARLRLERRGGAGDQAAYRSEFIEDMSESPVALVPDAANAQHYEVPAKFFEAVLGPSLKNSCGLWSDAGPTLERAETAMLDLTVERAALTDGQSVLELGCGWGSLTLHMAARFPASRIVAVSNSASQREFIEGRARRSGLTNVEIITADMNAFTPPHGDFDRVVSVEMFEHMRNWPELLRRIASWLSRDGLAFIHVFCHREFVYPFEVRDRTDWMAKHFFSGGLMPSKDLLMAFPEDLVVETHWNVSGTHYQQTAEAWLERMDARSDDVREAFRATYGPAADRFFVYWRIFFMACAELFGYDSGREWFVAHYRLRQRSGRVSV